MVILPFITLVLVIMALTNIFFMMPDTNQRPSQQTKTGVRQSDNGDTLIDLRSLSAKEMLEPSQAQSYDLPSDLAQKQAKNIFETDDIEDDPSQVKQFNKWDIPAKNIGAPQVKSNVDQILDSYTTTKPPQDNDLEMNSKQDEEQDQFGHVIKTPATTKAAPKQPVEKTPTKIVPPQLPISYSELIHGGWRLTPSALRAVSSLPNAEVVSWQSPHAVILREVLTHEECEHLKRQAEPALTRSKVVAQPDKQTSQARTSYGAFLNGQYRDEKVKEIEQRLHKLLQIPYEFGESLYVLRYQNEQKYDPHMDYCARAGQVARDECQKFLSRAGGPICGEEHGGPTCGDRLLTAIIYLHKADKGGETVFPKAKGLSYNDPAKSCADDNVLKVAPNAGDVILFWNYIPKVSDEEALEYTRSGSYQDGDTDTEASPDPAAVHGACPVIEGEKWVVTRWIRSANFS
eukprot:TRINITY_DN8203_c0_g2_i1.p1 TRINITY_DN8203_c0_g2~~TRINITY_DN8203_c0_g2_i1.p1  ORF type:complete len:534 (-),score=53.55 TRINITY_DN8203_c0_g2_i1:1103-2479(-)